MRAHAQLFLLLTIIIVVDVESLRLLVAGGKNKTPRNSSLRRSGFPDSYILTLTHYTPFRLGVLRPSGMQRGFDPWLVGD